MYILESLKNKFLPYKYFNVKDHDVSKHFIFISIKG